MTHSRHPLRLVAALACWVCVAAIWLLVSHGMTMPFDRALVLAPREPGSLMPYGGAPATTAVVALTTFGGPLLRSLVALAGLAVLVVRRAHRHAVWLAVTVIGGWLLSDGIKLLTMRARPQVVPHLIDASGTAFPSAHAFNAVVVCGALALVVPVGTRAARLAVAAVLALAIGLSRVWLGVHWPSDVLAGWLGGLGWLLLAATALPES